MSAAREMIEYYREMQAAIPGSSMLREVMWQYIDMAQGGDGGDLGFEEGTTCRGYNYPSKKDAFFQEVCDGMGWVWRDPQ
jgi:hypothetical protein